MSNGARDQNEARTENDESTVRELIRTLVGEIAPVDSGDVLPAHILREELGYDSVREVELTFALEELFEFESFVVEDSPVMETVDDLENFTLEMIAQGRATVPARSAALEGGSLISTLISSPRPS